MMPMLSHGVALCRTAVSGWGGDRCRAEVAHGVAKSRTDNTAASGMADLRAFRGDAGCAVAPECDGCATDKEGMDRLGPSVPYPFSSAGIKIPTGQVPRRVLGGGVRGKRRRRNYPSPPAPSTQLGIGQSINKKQVNR